MENQRIVSAAVIGGLAAALLSTTPVINLMNCLCCAGVIFGGALGMFYYARLDPEPEPISPPAAITVGIVTGIFGAFFAVGLEFMFFELFGPWQIEFARDILEQMDDVPGYLEDMLSEIETQIASGFNWGTVLLENMIVLPLFCLIGSMIARVFINKNISEKR